MQEKVASPPVDAAGDAAPARAPPRDLRECVGRRRMKGASHETRMPMAPPLQECPRSNVNHSAISVQSSYNSTMLMRRDILELVPDDGRLSAETAAWLRGALFTSHAIRTAQWDRTDLERLISEAIDLSVSMSSASPEDLGRAITELLLPDTPGLLYDAWESVANRVFGSARDFDCHDVILAADPPSVPREPEIELADEERIWSGDGVARQIAFDRKTGRLAVVRDDSSVFFRIGSEWHPRKCEIGGFVDGEFVYYRQGAIRAYDPETGATRTIGFPENLAERVRVAAERDPEQRPYLTHNGRPENLDLHRLSLTNVAELADEPLFCLQSCRPEVGVAVTASGELAVSFFGDACCGHIDSLLPFGEGWLVPTNHGHSLRYFRHGVPSVQVRGDAGEVPSVAAVRARDGHTLLLNVPDKPRLILMDSTFSVLLEHELGWRESVYRSAISDDGQRIAVGSSGGRVRVLERDGRVRGELELDWPVDALSFAGNDNLFAAHGPGFLSRVRIS